LHFTQFKWKGVAVSSLFFEFNVKKQKNFKIEHKDPVVSLSCLGQRKEIFPANPGRRGRRVRVGDEGKCMVGITIT
jgi:hypothetical protein